jgi:hypothetical protein
MKGKAFSLFRRNRIYYVRFKLPDGKWSTAKSTSHSSKIKAENFAIDYIDKGQVVIKENITFQDFSKNFFDRDNEWAKEKRINGFRISEKWCIIKSLILNRYLLPTFNDYKLTEIDVNVNFDC